MFWNKNKPEEPKDARFMIDRGIDCWVIFQKINGRWNHRGNFASFELALDRLKELREYPMYFQ